MTPRTAMHPEPGDAVCGTLPNGMMTWRYVTRVETNGWGIYYATTPGGPEARSVSTWLPSWRNWVRKRQAKLVATEWRY